MKHQQQLTMQRQGRHPPEYHTSKCCFKVTWKYIFTSSLEVRGPAFSTLTKISRQGDANVFLLSPASPTFDTR